MKRVIVYTDIKEKNKLEYELAVKRTPEEALIHSLDVMDLMIALRKDVKREEEDDGIDWIILPLKKTDD